MIELANFRRKLELPPEFRVDHGQLRTSTERQIEIFDFILDNSHPAPGKDSSILMACEKVENIAMRCFLR